MKKVSTILLFVVATAIAMNEMHVYQKGGQVGVFKIAEIDSIKFTDIRFHDSFDEDMHESWWVLQPNAVPGTIGDGQLQLPGHERGTAEPYTEVFRMIDTSIIPLSHGDYTIETRVKMTGNATDFGAYGLFGIVFRNQSPDPSNWLNDSYQFGWDGNGNSNRWFLQQRRDGAGWSNIEPLSDAAPIEYGEWFKLRVVVQGPSIKCSVDLEDGEGWQMVFEHSVDEDDHPLYEGTVGLWSGWNYTPQSQYLDYFKVDLE